MPIPERVIPPAPLYNPTGPAGGDLAGTYPNPTVTDLTIAGEVHGDVLYRGAAGWVRLAAGVVGQFLRTAGAGANPTWANAGVFGYDGSAILRSDYCAGGATQACVTGHAIATPGTLGQDAVSAFVREAIYSPAADSGRFREVQPPYGATEARFVVNGRSIVAGGAGDTVILEAWGTSLAVATGLWTAWPGASVPVATIVVGVSIVGIQAASAWIPLATLGVTAARPAQVVLGRDVLDTLAQNWALLGWAMEWR